jgi:formate hydrogenlyase subunit 3/multisubunit Na+/H+ antiporter MnhD subunit
MPHFVPVEDMTTPGGLLLVLAVLVPFIGVLAGLVLGGRHAQRVALVTLLPGLGLAIAIADSLFRSGDTLVYLLGGWVPPLGIALRADWLAAVMLVTTAMVICGIGVYARADFGTPLGAREARAPLVFWMLLLAVWGSLNLVFVSGDLFTLYVALELLTFAGVPMVCLDGRGETLRAALRYLLFALLGSMLYLLGTVMLYGAYGTLDIPLLATRVRAEPVAWAAMALMTTGLLAKTALFPLHLWLPPAHAGAPAAASAVLSALVVKGSFFLIVRLWFDVMPGVVTLPSAQFLAALGAGAILFGSVVALRQKRLKLLIAYSTLAQIGYLFLMFPLGFDAVSSELQRGGALTGGLLQAISHATAKAAMFMAAGLIYKALGHDRIAELRGIARALPISVLAFALGGVALMGLPPSGAYLAKKLLLDAAAETGQWWWEFVLQAGGFFTASYVVLVLAHALWPANDAVKLNAPVRRLQEAAALALALCSMLLGLAAIGPVPLDTLSLAPEELWSAISLVLGGGVLALALGLGQRLPPVPVNDVALASLVRRATVAAGGMVERADGVLRRWPVAGLSLLVLVIGFVAAMLS